MYNGIGLATARGSGSNGHVESNKFLVKSRPTTTRDVVAENYIEEEDQKHTAGRQDILEHDRKRQIELKLVILEDKLIDHGYTPDEISQKLTEARNNLIKAGLNV